MVHPLGTTKNGIEVFVDLIGSPAAARIARQPNLLVLVKEVLEKTSFRDAEVSIACDMKRVIGYDFVVPTTEKDTIFYARPLRDSMFSRYVKQGKPIHSQSLVIVMRRNDKDEYELRDTWVGHISPPRPGSAGEVPESKDYWASHAIIADNQAIQLSSVTKTSPY